MFKKILLFLLAALVVAGIAFYAYVGINWDKKYDWPGPALTVSKDSAVIARGQYLVHGPAHCISCHVANFEDIVAADQGKDVPLRGGVLFPMGPLGTMATRNLTPDVKTGIGRYTDEQIFRMMRHGIRPDGTATMTVLMPFYNMADDDLVAIVSYLRSIEPVENPVADGQWTFMGKAVRTFSSVFKPIEKPDAPAVAPAMAPTIERGEYLARYVANCVGCHTQRDLMTYEATGPEYAGGMEFEPWPDFNKFMGADPDIWLKTPNITPDPGSHLSVFKTKEDFIKRFREGRRVMFSPMDWGPFSRMSDEDLEAIWMYLNSLEPVKNDIGEVAFKKG
jgi:mono/diheme cytochrome c family protein